jgi:hypothetical protein
MVKRNRFMIILALAFATSASAAEVDPYYSWIYPPHDGTMAVDKAVNDKMQFGLSEVNRDIRREHLACRDVARRVLRPLWYTAFWYPIGEARWWGADISPQSRSEMEDRYARMHVYRYSKLHLPGHMIAIDPAVRVNDVMVGTDKIGHFFTQGEKYYDYFVFKKAHGASDKQAERYAIETGLKREFGFLGWRTNGILSYGDLESNYQGLRLFRSLCEDPERGLRFDKRKQKWVLGAPFEISRWVNPCWDEGYYPSAFAKHVDRYVHRALKETCPLLQRPEIEARRRGYAARGCQSYSVQVLNKLIAKGKIPDPKKTSLDAVCGPLSAE